MPSRCVSCPDLWFGVAEKASEGLLVGCSRPPLFSFAVEHTFVIISCRWVQRHMSAHTCSVSSIKYKLASCWAGKKRRDYFLKAMALLSSKAHRRHLIWYMTPFYLMNWEASPANPPCDWAWLLKYIFMAISAACWTTFSLLAPSATFPCEALESKSYKTN